MNKEKLFESFYGFDKEWVIPEGVESIRVNDLAKDRHNYRYSTVRMTPKTASFLKNQVLGSQLYKYTVPIDGYTDEDFLNWAKNSNDQSPSTPGSWHVSKFTSKSVENFNHVDYLIQKFFTMPNARSTKTDLKRSEKVFRLIELNEFFARAKDNQTLKNFLETDSKIEYLCKNFIYHDYGKNSSNLISSDYMFMNFDKKFPIKARKIILELTKDDLKKVILDRNKNPLKNTPYQDTGSFSFLKAFIDHALGKVKLVERKALPSDDIQKAFTLNIIKDYNYWKNSSKTYGVNTKLQSAASLIVEAYIKNKYSDTFLTYLIENNLLEKYNPKETIAILIGSCNTKFWVSKTTGKDIREVAMDMADADEIVMTSLLDFICYIVCNDLDAVSGAKFDWSNFNNEMPSDWIYSLFQPVKSREPVLFNFRKL